MKRTCELCGHQAVYIQGHHIIPKADGGDDSPENIIDLCPNCHSMVHLTRYLVNRYGETKEDTELARKNNNTILNTDLMPLLSPSAWSLYCITKRWADDKGWVELSINDIARRLRCGRGTIIKALRELEANEVITCISYQQAWKDIWSNKSGYVS